MRKKGTSGSRPTRWGPDAFKFDSYEPRQKTVIDREIQNISGERLFLKQVIVRYIAAVNSRELGLQTGELQVIEGLKEDKWIEKMAARSLMSRSNPSVPVKPRFLTSI